MVHKARVLIFQGSSEVLPVPPGSSSVAQFCLLPVFRAPKTIHPDTVTSTAGKGRFHHRHLGPVKAQVVEVLPSPSQSVAMSGKDPNGSLPRSQSFELKGCLINGTPPLGLSDQPCILVLEKRPPKATTDLEGPQPKDTEEYRHCVRLMKGPEELVCDPCPSLSAMNLRQLKEHLDLEVLRQTATQVSPRRPYSIECYKQYRGVVHMRYECPAPASKYGKQELACADADNVCQYSVFALV